MCWNIEIYQSTHKPDSPIETGYNMKTVRLCQDYGDRIEKLTWFRKIGFLTDLAEQTQMTIRETWLSRLRDE